MSAAKKRFCVFGCDALDVQGVPLHRFPNPESKPNLFAAWVSAIGDKLRRFDRNRTRTKRICDQHFDPASKLPNGRLIWSAIPKINLHRMQQTVSSITVTDHSYCRPRREYLPSVILADTTHKPGPSTGDENFNLPGSSKSGPSIPCTQTTAVEGDRSYAQQQRKYLADVTNLQDSTMDPVPSGSSSSTCLTTKKKSHARTSLQKLDADKTFEYLENKTITSYTKKERKHKNEIRRLRQKMKSYKIRLQAIRKNSIVRNFENFTKNMSESAKLFTRMQFMEGRKKKQGRRFTQEEKILSLSLFKKSPKAYKLMCKHFTLPSRKVLKSLLAQIKLSPGINPIIFEELKETVSNMVLQDRLCTLIFDEMSITPQIQYNIYTDDLVGFENYGKEKTANFANHVLVFMVKGVKKNFKQPVAYYFTQTLKTIKLKEIINEVITNVQATGLKIIATVCDQSSTNVSAINNLIAEAKKTYLQVGKEWRKDIILINNNEIIPLYDAPHLMKGIRNNLLNKEMIYVHESKIKNVKWEYFQRVFEADRSHGELRLLPKLTMEHIEPEKIKKMRVKNAVQVLSYSMAVATDNLVARGSVPEICREVIPFILMVDKVFDSLNGSSFSPANGKQYRCAVKRNSPHHELWNEAIEMFQTIKFMVRKNENRLVERTVPSVNNLIKTIEGFKSVWQLLFKKYGLDAMMTRNFNQDPLENFFGSIRSLGARNVTPNCMGFEGAFKTLLLNNFSSNHSTNANCEEDTNDCLQSLSFFIKNKERKGLSSAPLQSQNVVIDQPLEVMQNTRNISDPGADQRTYVCGWALSKCLQKVIKGCKNCKSKLLGNSDNDMYKYIKAKEYTKNKKWLCYPSDCLVACFQEIQDTTVAFLNNESFKIHIKERIKTFINLFIDFDFIDCNIHKDTFRECFVDTSINIIIYSWCRSVNRILDGKLTYDGEDITKLAAQAYYTKHKTHKK